MRETFEWSVTPARALAARETRAAVFPIALRSALYSLGVTAAALGLVRVVAPAFPLPYAGLLAMSVLISAPLLLAPLLVLVSPGSKYRVDDKGIYAAGRRLFVWRELEGFVYPTDTTGHLLLVARNGQRRRLDLSGQVNAPEIVDAFGRGASRLEAAQVRPGLEALRFTEAQAVVFFMFALANAVVMGFETPHLLRLFPHSLDTLWLLALGTPTAALAWVATWLRCPGFPAAAGYAALMGLLLTDSLSAIFTVAFLVRG